MSKQEFGSEFTEEEPQAGLNRIYKKENIYEFLLGRTALDFIIQDILEYRKIRRVLLPSYCCHTMIMPFLRNGVQVGFYNVSCDTQQGIKCSMDATENFDCVLVMQYFGFYNQQHFDLVQKLKAMDKIVIEDATHSILQLNPYSDKSDYVFVSYRKWMAVKGGAVVIKRYGPKCCGENRGKYCLDNTEFRDEYLSLKQSAIAEKRDYLARNLTSEKMYLQKFSDAEELIEREYVNFQIDEESRNRIRYTDYDFIGKKRRENAKCLLECLEGIERIKPIFCKITEKDTPLFFPICVGGEERNKLRRYLIQQKIYLPVHWPLSDFHIISQSARELYDEELSVICDQRYNVEDMKYIGTKIRDWMKENE